MKKMLFPLIAFICFNAFIFTTQASPQKNSDKAILVTGSNAGIGLKITEHLVKQGFHVYAGARKDKDLKKMNAMKNVTAVRLDVTKQEDIDKAVEFVKKQGRGLFGVVNNAGVGTFSRMSEIPDDEVLWMHDVNVMGPHRVNKAFLPLLKESKGRTVTISSISGYITGATSGAYSMSKFAVEAYTESLAADLAKDGVYVGVVDPGAYRSRIREKVTLHGLTGKYQLDQKLSDEQKKRLEEVKKRNEELKEPDEVAEAVVKAMTAEKPALRYMVAPTKEQADITIRTTRGRVLQLNNDQPYELSRDELVKLLDELIAEQKKSTE